MNSQKNQGEIIMKHLLVVEDNPSTLSGLRNY